jgi:maltokinase
VTPLSALQGQLAGLLPAHVSRQRWYGGKHQGAEMAEVEVRVVEELASAWPMVLRVVIASGTGECYQLILGLRPVGTADVSSVGDVAAVGEIDTPEGRAFCFDGLVDPDVGLLLLAHVAPSQEAVAVRPIGAEQSNTSLVYDERLILKVFRRLTGANPEIEVTLALAEQGFAHVAEPLAVWRTNGDDLAVLQRFLPGAAEGWAMALTSIRAVLDEGVDPAEAGGDLAPEAERLGTVTAELHLALTQALGAAPGDVCLWADEASARVAAVHHPDLDTDGIATLLGKVRTLPDPGSAIRVHGDYHLGQVMRTDEGWFVLDFEGEPTRPVEERRRPSSPLRDVAGMLRSIDYAAAVGLREQPEAVDALAWAWRDRNREAFLSSYLSRLGGTSLLPADPGATAELLRLFELDKAVYEVGYEQAHRPDWVQIPLDAVRRLVDGQ